MDRKHLGMTYESPEVRQIDLSQEQLICASNTLLVIFASESAVQAEDYSATSIWDAGSVIE